MLLMHTMRVYAYLLIPVAGIFHLANLTVGALDDNLDPASFSWSHAPLSSREVPIQAGMAYLMTVFSLQQVVALFGGPPKKGSVWYLSICRAQAYHNMFLCLASLFMFICCVNFAWERLNREGWRWLFCEAEDATPAEGSLYFVAYVYYISKFYELFDTFLQILKSGYVNSPWLHLYHHALVMLMAWLWLEYRQSLMFIGLAFNTFVHIPMYYYYYRTSSSAGLAFHKDGTPVETNRLSKPTWGSYVTRLQIFQFSTSGICLVVSLVGFVLPGGKCSGMGSLAFNFVFNTTLLAQFVTLFKKNKRSDQPTPKKTE